MHCSTRLNGKPKHRNLNMPPPPYNAGVHFVSTAPNVSHMGQLQINKKYVNNINEVSVLQYQRTANNMQIKNNPETNHYQSVRQHQQQQPFVYKTNQYHQQHIHPNGPPKFLGQFAVQRKFFKDHIVTQDAVQPLRHAEFSSKKSKDLQNQQEANKLNNFNNNITQIMSRKFDENRNSNREEIKSNNEETAISHNQVPDYPAVVEENNTQLNQEDTNKLEVQQDVEQVLNINNENNELDHGEDVNDKSAKSSREKTPMCLINDLARFNKISFQYRLTTENGPAHCKRFTVTLKLGDEEYTAEGFKIKKAQHLAAKEAIEKTKYKHPTPKTNRRTDENNVAKSNITPTVELNALAMKLGQQTYYIFDPKQMENNTNYISNHQHYEVNKNALQQPPNMGVVENVISSNKQFVNLNQKRQFLSKFQNRYTAFQHSLPNVSAPGNFTYFPSTSPCKITLIVGNKQFVGVGRTLQQAKHDAASNALQVLKEQVNNAQSEAHNDSMEDNDNKSPISLVFELGIKRNLPVDFKVLREEGPAHMRTFITACIVGDLVTEGEGTGKKISKKKAAQKMLEELKKLPPITPVASPVKRVKLKISSKKPSAATAKSLNQNEPKEDSERPWHKNKKVNVETEEANPITKLIEWHQNKKEKEPIFKLISEFGKENSRRRQFVMEVSSNNIVARGVGNSKKLAKRDAAQNFLIAITSVDDPTEENVTNTPADNSLEIKKPVLETTVPTKPLRIETNSNLLTPKDSSQETDNNISKILPNTSSSTSLISAAPTAKESTPPPANTTTSKSPNLHMKDQLMYLAKLLGFEVEFSDYPKGNHNEFLTIVMLSTNPPQICHGVGVNAKESQEDAAKNALKILSEMGLNNAVNT